MLLTLSEILLTASEILPTPSATNFIEYPKDGNIRMESKEDTDKIQFRKDNFKEYL